MSPLTIGRLVSLSLGAIVLSFNFAVNFFKRGKRLLGFVFLVIFLLAVCAHSYLMTIY